MISFCYVVKNTIIFIHCQFLKGIFNEVDNHSENVVLRVKIDTYSGGLKPKGEPRESRGRPRRCNRGRNLP
jgi:hypothetical protein